MHGADGLHGEHGAHGVHGEPAPACALLLPPDATVGGMHGLSWAAGGAAPSSAPRPPSVTDPPENCGSLLLSLLNASSMAGREWLRVWEGETDSKCVSGLDMPAVGAGEEVTTNSVCSALSMQQRTAQPGAYVDA